MFVRCCLEKSNVLLSSRMPLLLQQLWLWEFRCFWFLKRTFFWDDFGDRLALMLPHLLTVLKLSLEVKNLSYCRWKTDLTTGWADHCWPQPVTSWLTQFQWFHSWSAYSDCGFGHLREPKATLTRLKLEERRTFFWALHLLCLHFIWLDFLFLLTTLFLPPLNLILLSYFFFFNLGFQPTHSFSPSLCFLFLFVPQAQRSSATDPSLSKECLCFPFSKPLSGRNEALSFSLFFQLLLGTHSPLGFLHFPSVQTLWMLTIVH